MKKRLKYYLAFLVVLMLATGAGWLIFVQARRQSQERLVRFDAERAESLRVTERLLHQAVTGTTPVAQASSLHGEGRQDACATMIAPPSPARRRVNILKEMSALLRSSPAVDLDVIESHPYSQIRLGEKDADDKGILLPSGLKIIQGPLRGSLAGLSAIQNAQREANSTRGREKNKVEPAGAAAAKCLDQFENLLLDCDWILPEFRDLQQNRYDFRHFNYWHRLALLRALGRGEDERAARLFVKGLEFYNTQYLCCYPNGTQYFEDLPFTILLLAELPEFPARALDEAQALLETSRLAPAQRSELRKAHALRWIAAKSKDRHVSQGDNFIHWINVNGVGPDTLTLWLCWPKFQQCLLDYATAWEAEDWAATGQVLTRLQSYATIVNCDPEAIRYFLEDLDPNWEYRWATNPNLVRLALAAARYRRAVGTIPASLADLVPDYLAESQAAEDGAKWRFCRAEPINLPLKNGGSLMEPARTLFYHVRRYRELRIPGEDGSLEPNSPDPRVNPPALFPCDAHWDGECAFYVRMGYRQTGTFNVAEVAYFPIQVQDWRKIMEQFRTAGLGIKINGPLERNPANQTTQTAQHH